jgi:protein-S-isoprenylcysteine O-methyltransferase Ste14
MRTIDLPPVWLLGFLVFAWAIRVPAFWDGSLVFGIAVLLLAALLMSAAFVEFSRARTTIIPRKEPSALITRGIFRFTRNPIYLADLLILAGFSVIWGSAVGLGLVPVLTWLLQRRFIVGEEERLRNEFGAHFESYSTQTRRWL